MKTTPRLALFSLVLILGLVAWHRAAGQPAAKEAKRHPLFKIQGPKATVYLLGSVHFLKQENYPLPDVIEKAFEGSKIVVFESDLSAMEKPETQMLLMSKGALPPGQTLKSQISPKLYEKLAAHMKESGLPIEVMQSFKPGMVAMTLAVAELQRLGLDPTMGVDHQLHKRARKAGKEIRGLEATEFQVDLITGFSKEEGEAVLESTLKDMRLMKDELGAMINAWQSGDMKGLGALLNKALEDHPALFKRLLVDRNQNWLPKIEELTRGDKDAIVVVGAGHLAGKGSVIELLEKNGAKVVQQ